MKAGWIVAVLVLAHLALSLGFNLAAPYRQAGTVDGEFRADIGAPDERAHANYVAYVLDTGRLPVFRPRSPDLQETFQSHQPPLYYWLAAGWSRALGLDTRRKEDGHALRALNALFGASTVVGAFWVGFLGFGRRFVGVTAASIVALLPMHAAVTGAVTNDALLYALCAWAFVCALLGLRRGWRWGTALAAGGLIGAALLTKTSALVLFLPLLLALFWGKARFGLWALSLLLPLAIAAPWWARNEALYGDPLAIAPFYEAFRSDVDVAALAASPREAAKFAFNVARTTALSFVGVFGYMHVVLPAWAYVAAWVALGAGLLFAVRWARSAARDARRAAWLCGLTLLAILGLYLRFNLDYYQPQARYLLHGLPLLGSLIGAGLADLRRRVLALAFLCAVLLAVALLALRVMPAEFGRQIEELRAQEPLGPVSCAASPRQALTTG